MGKHIPQGTYIIPIPQVFIAIQTKQKMRKAQPFRIFFLFIFLHQAADRAKSPHRQRRTWRPANP